jgi:hypothetical protein
MSTPTPGPDFSKGGAPQGQPGWGAPQQQPYQQPGYQQPGYEQPGYQQPGYQQPGYQQPQPGYQPAPSYSGGPAGYGAPAGQRPRPVSTAAVIGIVWGGLGTLFGLLALIAIGLVFSYSALLGIFVLLGLAASIAMLVAGIQTLQGKSPKLLLYLSYASIAIQLLSLIFSLASGYGFSFGSLLGFIVPIVIVAMLMQPVSKQYYAARGISY